MGLLLSHIDGSLCTGTTCDSFKDDGNVPEPNHKLKIIYQGLVGINVHSLKI